MHFDIFYPLDLFVLYNCPISKMAAMARSVDLLKAGCAIVFLLHRINIFMIYDNIQYQECNEVVRY